MSLKEAGKIIDNRSHDLKKIQNRFRMDDVWFIETTNEGDLKIVTRENEDTFLFRGTCSILFDSKTITVR